MDRRAFGSFLTYALMLTLIGSIFSVALTVQPARASHSNILLDEDIIDIKYDPGERITISGSIDDVDSSEDIVNLSVTGPGTSDDDDQEHDDGDFEFEYDIEDDADDGIYTIEVEYDGDSVFSYFLIDEDNDDVEVDLDNDVYSPGDTVEVSGNNVDPQTGEDELQITIEDPDGNDDYSTDTDLDGDSYSQDIDLENDAVHGKYAVTVEYAGDEGYAIFEVLDEDSGGSDDPITIELNDTTYQPGDSVVISGEVDHIEQGQEVFVTVEDDAGDEVFNDSDEPTSGRDYEFEFDLDDDADPGIYEVKVEYDGDEETKTFSVSTSGGSTGGGGSGSDSGLTGRLSKTSLLAGETITVTGVVPKIIADQPVNIVVLKPDGRSAGVYYYPEPSSDKSYTATLRLPPTLEEDEDYTVVVGYDNKEVRLNFDVTGKTTGSGGAVSVQVDKTSYIVGSTVKITGEIADDTFVPGLKIALQVYNPDKALYRTDPISPEDDGTFSYSMPVGGPLGVSGKWVVKVTYNSQTAETGFDLSGGVASKPRFDLKFEDQTFPIEYESDGDVRSMYVRPTEKTLVVAIDGAEEGELTIKLPREVIDAVQSGSDIKFVVSILDTDTGDEKLVEVMESLTSSDSRTLVIGYDQGTDLIEIQGTTIVPEFGAIAGIVMAIAVFGMIAITSRFSGRFNTFRFW